MEKAPFSDGEGDEGPPDLEEWLVASDEDLGPDADELDVEEYNLVLRSAWKRRQPSDEDEARKLVKDVLEGRCGNWVLAATRRRRREEQWPPAVPVKERGKLR